MFKLKKSKTYKDLGHPVRHGEQKTNWSKKKYIIRYQNFFFLTFIERVKES